MSISISNQIYLLQNGSGSHTRPLPQITYDNDYIYIIVGNIFDPPKIVKCDYNLNIIQQMPLTNMHPIQPGSSLHPSILISDEQYLYLFSVDTQDAHYIYIHKFNKSNLNLVNSQKIVPDPNEFGNNPSGGYYILRYNFNSIIYNDYIFLLYANIDRNGIDTENENQRGYLYLESINKNTLSVISRIRVFSSKLAATRIKYTILQWQQDNLYVLDGYDGRIYQISWNRDTQVINTVSDIGQQLDINQQSIRVSDTFIYNNALHSTVNTIKTNSTVIKFLDILSNIYAESNINGTQIVPPSTNVESGIVLTNSIPNSRNYDIVIYAHKDSTGTFNKFGYIIYKYNTNIPSITIAETGSIDIPNNVVPRALSTFAVIKDNKLYFSYKDTSLPNNYYLISINLPSYFTIPDECSNLQNVEQGDIIKVSTANQIQACLRQYGDSQQDISQYTRIAADILNTFIQKTNTLLNTNLDYVNNNTVIAAEKINELINILKNGG